MISSKVSEIMKDKGMTYEAIQKATGLSPQTVARARGPRIGTCTLNTLAAIAGALGVRTKDLYEESDG